MRAPFLNIKSAFTSFTNDSASQTLHQSVTQYAYCSDELAVFTLDNRHESKPFKPTFYLLIFGLNGNCKVTVGLHSFDIQAETISLIAEHQLCSFSAFSADFQGITIFFKKEFLLGSYLKDAVMEELLRINPDYPPSYSVSETGFTGKTGQKFTNLIDELKNQGPYHLNIIRLKLLELLYDYNRACEYCLMMFKKRMNRSYQLTQAFKTLVHERYAELRSVNDYAKLLKITPKYLSEIVKSETGTSALTIIHARLLVQSQYILRHTDNSIKEIAAMLGFESTSHFCRFFKKRTNKSPAVYRHMP